jgi:hypothetical protein
MWDNEKTKKKMKADGRASSVRNEMDFSVVYGVEVVTLSECRRSFSVPSSAAAEGKSAFSCWCV